MSGRIRTVKPEWLEDEKLLRAGSDARVLSVALILLADDYGNGRFVHKVFDGQVFPFDERPGILANALERLTRAGYVRLYRVRGQTYFHICNWSRHQRVDRPGKPRVPGPEASDSEAIDDTRETLARVPRDPRETLATDHDHDHDHDHDPDHDRGRASARGLWERFDGSRAQEYLEALAEHWPGLTVRAGRQRDAAQGLCAHFGALPAAERCMAFARLAAAYRADEFAPRSVATFLAESDLTKFANAPVKSRKGPALPAPHAAFVGGDMEF